MAASAKTATSGDHTEPLQISTSVTALESRNNAHMSEIEQPAETAASAKTAASGAAGNHTAPIQAIAPVAALLPQNSAPMPKIEQPAETASSNTKCNHRRVTFPATSLCSPLSYEVDEVPVTDWDWRDARKTAKASHRIPVPLDGSSSRVPLPYQSGHAPGMLATQAANAEAQALASAIGVQEHRYCVSHDDSYHIKPLPVSTPVTAPESQNNAPKPRIELPAKTAASSTGRDHTELPQASTLVAALQSQNSTLMPEIKQPAKTAASDTASASTSQAPELTTEPGYTATTTERAADSQAWASVLQRAQPTAKALRALPDIIRFESEAATAHLNKHPVELQQLANLRYQEDRW